MTFEQYAESRGWRVLSAECLREDGTVGLVTTIARQDGDRITGIDIPTGTPPDESAWPSIIDLCEAQRAGTLGALALSEAPSYTPTTTDEEP